MNPKRSSELLEREWGHHVCQVMDLALGGTPQQLAPHLPWVSTLSVFLYCLNVWILKAGRCLGLLSRLWPSAIFIY